MNSNYDVILVGAGPAGIFCAYELMVQNKGLKVLLVEKGADIYSTIVMLLAIREYYHKTGVLKGVKVAGGIKTAEEAILYNNLYKYFITSNFDNTHFRIGCSQLFEKIKEKLS